MAKIDLRDLAMRGAAARVAELRDELTGLYQAFPALRKGNLDDPFTRRTRSSKSDGAAPAVKRRKRKGMTAAQKAEVSKRMKKYWASRRKAAAK